MKELDSLAMTVTRNSLPQVVFVNTNKMFIERGRPINVINVILKPLIDLIYMNIITDTKESDSLAMSVTRFSVFLVVFVNTNEMFMERRRVKKAHE